MRLLNDILIISIIMVFVMLINFIIKIVLVDNPNDKMYTNIKKVLLYDCRFESFYKYINKFSNNFFKVRISYLIFDLEILFIVIFIISILFIRKFSNLMLIIFLVVITLTLIEEVRIRILNI